MNIIHQYPFLFNDAGFYGILAFLIILLVIRWTSTPNPSVPEPPKTKDVGKLKADFFVEGNVVKPAFQLIFTGSWTDFGDFEMIYTAQQQFDRWLQHRRDLGFIRHENHLYPFQSVTGIDVTISPNIIVAAEEK